MENIFIRILTVHTGVCAYMDATLLIHHQEKGYGK